MCEAFEAHAKPSGKGLKYYAHYPFRARILAAGRVLFAFDKEVPILGKKTTDKLEKMQMEDRIIKGLTAIVITFARIPEDDLNECKKIPLTLDVLPVLSHMDIGMPERNYFSLLKSFDVFSLLLLGRHIY